MKNPVKLAVIPALAIAVAAVICFLMTACGDPYGVPEERARTDGELVIDGFFNPSPSSYYTGKTGVEARASMEGFAIVAAESAWNKKGGKERAQWPTDYFIIDYDHYNDWNNQIILKVYKWPYGLDPYQNYKGNDKKVKFTVSFFRIEGTKGNGGTFWVGGESNCVVYANFNNGKGQGIFGQEVSTDGRLTITGLEAHEGKEIYARGRSNYFSTEFYAVDRSLLKGKDSIYDPGWDENLFAGAVNSGQVVLKVYQKKGYSSYSDYNENDQEVLFWVFIFYENKEDEAHYFEQKGTVTVNFTDGIASGVFVPE